MVVQIGKKLKRYSFFVKLNMAEPRRTSIPILHTRGTFYEVGYDVVSLLLTHNGENV